MFRDNSDNNNNNTGLGLRALRVYQGYDASNYFHYTHEILIK